MNRKIFVFIIVLSSLNSCSKTPSDYYPLDEGLKWNYNMVLSSKRSVMLKVVLENMEVRKLNNQFVVPQKAIFENSATYTFIKTDETGILTIGKQDVNDSEPHVFNIPKYIIKNPLKVGTSWKSKRGLLFASSKTDVEITEKIVAVDETVTTQAGTFENCLKIKGYGESFVKDPWFGWMDSSKKIKIKVEVTDYYAPQVGFVKGLYSEKSNSLNVPGGEMSNDLVSFEK